MKVLSTHLRYGAAAQSFHWLTVILVVAAYVLSPGGTEQQVYAAAADVGRSTHETLGIAVMAVVLLRLLWRMVDCTPDSPPIARWMKLSSRFVQFGLYGLLVALPIMGIAGAWLEGHPLTLYGLGNIGPLLSPAHDLGHTIADFHTVLGNIILWIAGLHAAAALFHHFVLRDHVLVSMLPGRS
jgi:cytochrome b561